MFGTDFPLVLCFILKVHVSEVVKSWEWILVTQRFAGFEFPGEKTVD